MTLTVFPSSRVSYNIEKSLRFRAEASARLSRTPAVAGNRQMWTWSGWVKRSIPDVAHNLFGVWQGTTTNAHAAIRFNASNFLTIYDFNSTAFEYILTTTQSFRDTASWYHIVVAVDTTQVTASNRVKIYVNGQQVTSFRTATYPTLNYSTYTNSATITYLGADASLASGGAATFFNGYLAEVNFISGLARDASYFGEISPITNSWSPRKYAGTHGTTGFYLKFTDSSSLTSGSNTGLGKDFSGNNNYFNTTSISITAGATYDSMLDVPTLTSSVASNYCVLNSIDLLGTVSSAATVTYGGLRATTDSATGSGVGATIAVNRQSNSKFYWEVTFVSGVTTAAGAAIVGIANSGPDGAIVTTFEFSSSETPTFTNGSVIGLTFDNSSNTLTFYKNNVLAKTITGVTTSNHLVPFIRDNIGGGSVVADFNFGQRLFTYSPPTGFKRLTAFNLAEPLIKNPNLHMTTTIYSGTGLPRTFVNAGKFQPGLIWAKSRTEAGYSTIVNDSIRGASKNLYTNLTNAEDSTSYITSLNSDGFSVGGTAGIGAFAQNYVAWQWKTSLASTTNTAGSLTSTIRANLTAGISVVQFTLASTAVSTVGHGLNVAPTMIIVKLSSTTGNWLVYHNYLGPTKYIVLDAQAGPVTTAGSWNNTAPTSSVFTLGNFYQTGNTAIAYCFSEVEGYSKFGSYIGNGNVNGAFVYTGFRPAFIMIKRADAPISNWTILDSTRNQFNVTNALLYANLALSEDANNDMDFVSNGFKARIAQNNMNAASAPYIYIAFAESPFKYSNAR